MVRYAPPALQDCPPTQVLSRVNPNLSRSQAHWATRETARVLSRGPAHSHVASRPAARRMAEWRVRRVRFEESGGRQG